MNTTPATISIERRIICSVLSAVGLPTAAMSALAFIGVYIKNGGFKSPFEWAVPVVGLLIPLVTQYLPFAV